MSIVLLHSINFIAGWNYHESEGIDKWLIGISNFLSFGTTAFIFISAVLLTHAYPDKLPNGFYWKRVKYILFPFLFVSVFYAFFQNASSLNEFPKAALLNFLGKEHWFVIVIFQFYLLYPLLSKVFDRLPMKIVLLITLMINIIYLGVFNFSNPPASNDFILYVWNRGYWTPFTGWIFYFALAYYIGKNYQSFLNKIQRWRKQIICFSMISGILVIATNNYINIGFGSKRIDMIPFAICAILLLFLYATNLRTTPKVLTLISRYSYGIYLLHMFFLILFYKILTLFNALEFFGYFGIPLLFVLAISGSIMTIYIANKTAYGKYLVGNVVGKNTRIKSNKVVTS